jgi:hypothetical protein
LTVEDGSWLPWEALADKVYFYLGKITEQAFG